MQLLLDSVKFQKQKGLNVNRHILNEFRNDEEALKEAAEQIRTIVSECIDRKLPIDDALAALHVATVTTNQSPDYAAVLANARKENNHAIKHASSQTTVNLFKKIDDEYKIRVNRLMEQIKDNQKATQ